MSDVSVNDFFSEYSDDELDRMAGVSEYTAIVTRKQAELYGLEDGQKWSYGLISAVVRITDLIPMHSEDAP